MIYRLFLMLSMAVAASLSAQEAEPNVILVKFRQEASPADISAVETRHGLAFRDEIKLFRIRSYRYEGASSPTDKGAAVAAEPAVEIAEPNWVRTLKVADPEYPNQWYLKNTGQSVDGYAGPAGIDIRWEGARQRFVERGKVRVAVIDSGVAFFHPDIVRSVGFSAMELNGIDGYDDDGNGVVDDVVGYDFYDLDDDPRDQNGHGTQVAGVIAAAIDSNGVAGISNSVVLRCYRAFDQFGRTGEPKLKVRGNSVKDTLLSLAAALSDGCKVLNLSYGGVTYSALEADVFRIKLPEFGAIAVIAAGNESRDNDGETPSYPASYDSSHIISVAAQNRTGALAGFSNWGAVSVDLAAPGTQIRAPDVNRQTVHQYLFQDGLSGWSPGMFYDNYSASFWTLNSGFLWDRDVALYSRSLPGTHIFLESPLFTPPNLAGGLRLEIGLYHDLADDVLYVEASRDRVTWQPFLPVIGEGAGVVPYDFSDMDGGPFYVRFRLKTDFNPYTVGIGVGIAGVRLTAVDDLDLLNPQYRYTQGTSFSAPIVAGVAAMVWAHRPELTAQQVRQIILDTARPVPALSGKVATGGMVDAEAALQRADLVSGNVLPVVLSQPSGGTYSAGSTATLSVSATQGLPVTYQWRRNGVAIPGATSSTLTLSGLGASTAGNYDVVVTSKAGSVTSSAAPVLLDTPLVLVSGPSSRLVRAGESVELAAIATAGSPIAYQWLHKGKVLPGATQSTLLIASASAANAGDYTVALASGAYSLVTPAAKLEVATLVTDLPATAAMLPGGKLSLAVKVSGVKPTYSWRRDGVVIPGAIGAKLAVVSGTPGTTSEHKVTFSTALGTLESRTCAVTTVVPALATWSQSPALVIAGQPLRLECVVEGTGPLALQWLKKGKPIPGATSASLEISAATLVDAGAYSLRVTGPANTFVTPARTVAVAEVLINKSVAPTVLLATGKTAKLTATVVGAKGAALQWSRDGLPLAGQTTATLTVSSPGQYQVTMTTAAGQKAATATVVRSP